MRRKPLNTKGFAPLALVITVAAVLVIGGAGAYVYHRNHKSKTSAVSDNAASTKTSTQTSKSSTTDNAANPYAGWDSYTTKYDKLSFKYPSTWKLTDQSSTDSADVTPGQDSVSVISSDGLEVSIGAGDIEFTPQPPTKVLSSTPISMLGGSYYLTFGSNNDTETTTGGALITTTTAFPTTSTFPQSKNITWSSSAVNGLSKPFDLISLDYDDVSQSSPHQYSVSTFQQDPNYQTAIAILESLTY